MTRPRRGEARARNRRYDSVTQLPTPLTHTIADTVDTARLLAAIPPPREHNTDSETFSWVMDTFFSGKEENELTPAPDTAEVWAKFWEQGLIRRLSLHTIAEEIGRRELENDHLGEETLAKFLKLLPRPKRNPGLSAEAKALLDLMLKLNIPLGATDWSRAAKAHNITCSDQVAHRLVAYGLATRYAVDGVTPDPSGKLIRINKAGAEHALTLAGERR